METEEILAAIQKAADTIATPNWADIASAGLSLLAVLVAEFVAWKQYGITKKQNEISEQQAKIMDQQNKIAVFDKQYELYDITAKCLHFSKCLSLSMGISSGTVNLSNIRLVFLQVFSNAGPDSETLKNLEYTFYFQETYKIRTKLCQAEFIFSKEISEDISKPLLALADSLSGLVCADVFTKSGIPLEMLILKYCSAAEKVEAGEVIQKMKNELQLENAAM